ncbi:hypothetical protein HanPI659440_Chr09g0350871 [Helianthus annuus]|nr:hypothetical protein HanPI659440_Chr09g0350871 [Helianthus annuus]
MLRWISSDLRWKDKVSGATVNYGTHRNLRWALYKNVHFGC